MIHGFFFVPLLVGHAQAESVHLSYRLIAKPQRVTEALARAPPTIWQGAADGQPATRTRLFSLQLHAQCS